MLALSKVERSSAMYRLMLGVILLITVALAFSHYLSLFDFEPNYFAGLTDLVSGNAYKPYVTRLLIPFLIRLIASVLPMRLELIATVLMGLSLIGFVFAFRYLLTAFWQASILSDMLTWFSIFCLLPLMVTFSRQVYDFTTLFFFTLELGLLAHRKWKWFLIVFPLVCLNRETAILLPLVFAVHFYPRVERQFFLKMLSAQGLIFIVIRAYILWLFKDNPGGALDWHLALQLYILGQIPLAFITFSPIGLLALLYVLCGFVILFLMLYKWKEKPQFLRDGALAIGPLLVLSYMLFGMPFELRVFYEAYPVVLLLCVEPIFSRLNRELEAASLQSPVPQTI